MQRTIHSHTGFFFSRDWNKKIQNKHSKLRFEHSNLLINDKFSLILFFLVWNFNLFISIEYHYYYYCHSIARAHIHTQSYIHTVHETQKLKVKYMAFINERETKYGVALLLIWQLVREHVSRNKANDDFIIYYFVCIWIWVCVVRIKQ